MSNPDNNPCLETPPNFQAAGYAPICQALIAQNQVDGAVQNDEWAAKQLLDAWEEDRQTRQTAWDEAVAQEERERAEVDTERLREEEEVRKAEEKKRKAKFPPIIRGMLPPKDSGFRPCEKAITKLKNREFIALWFFTFAGCQITRDTARQEEDSVLSWTQEDGNVLLRRSSSTASYKHLIVPDERLTWKDLLQARNVFLEQISKHGWPEEYLQMFTQFYCTLELRSELRQAHGHGEKVLVLYHARARREWFTFPFDISVINEEWMNEAYKDMWDSVHMQELRKVEEKVKSLTLAEEPNTNNAPFHPTMVLTFLQINLPFMLHATNTPLASLPQNILPHATLLHCLLPHCFIASCLIATRKLLHGLMCPLHRFKYMSSLHVRSTASFVASHFAASCRIVIRTCLRFGTFTDLM